MEDNHRKILEKNRQILVNNISMADDLQALLVEKGMMSGSMLADVKRCNGRTSMVEKFLDLVVMRNGVYEKLCDILQSTGHVLIADFLRDQAVEIPDHHLNTEMNIDDLCQTLPFLRKTSEKERTLIKDYINQKVQEKSLRETWRTNYKEKQKVIETKGKQLDQEWEYESRATEDEQKIKKLKKQCQHLTEEVERKETEIHHLSQQLKDAKAKHNKIMSDQLNLNAASSSTIHRLDDRFLENEAILTEFDHEITQFLSRDVGEAIEVMSIRAKFDKLFDKIKQFEAMKQNHDDIVHERMVIGSYLGLEQSDVQLAQTFKTFVTDKHEQTESDTQQLKELNTECLRLNRQVKSLEFVLGERNEMLDQMNRNKQTDNMSVASSCYGSQSSVAYLSPRNISPALSPVVSTRVAGLRVSELDKKPSSAPNSPMMMKRRTDQHQLPPLKNDSRNKHNHEQSSKQLARNDNRKTATTNVVNISI